MGKEKEKSRRKWYIVALKIKLVAYSDKYKYVSFEMVRYIV